MLKNNVLEFFIKKGFHPIENLVPIVHEYVLAFERNGEDIYIIVCDNTMSETDLKNSLSAIAANSKNIYIVAPSEKYLYVFAKRHVFQWFKENIGFGTGGNILTLHFQTLQKLQTNGLTWEILSL